MNDIEKFKGDNIGGIISYEFIPVDDVEFIDEPVDGTITTPIVLKPLKYWFDGYGTLGSIGFTENAIENINGVIFAQQFIVFVPKNEPALNNLFNKMRNRKYIIKLKNGNDQCTIVGSLASPLKILPSLNTGTDMANRNGHAVIFSTESTHKAYGYNI